MCGVISLNIWTKFWVGVHPVSMEWLNTASFVLSLRPLLPQQVWNYFWFLRWAPPPPRRAFPGQNRPSPKWCGTWSLLSRVPSLPFGFFPSGHSSHTPPLISPLASCPTSIPLFKKALKKDPNNSFPPRPEWLLNLNTFPLWEVNLNSFSKRIHLLMVEL